MLGSIFTLCPGGGNVESFRISEVVSGFGSRVSGFGFRVQGLGFTLEGLGLAGLSWLIGS